jgi:hypothetical protein
LPRDRSISLGESRGDEIVEFLEGKRLPEPSNPLATIRRRSGSVRPVRDQWISVREDTANRSATRIHPVRQPDVDERDLQPARSPFGAIEATWRARRDGRTTQQLLRPAEITVVFDDEDAGNACFESAFASPRPQPAAGR